MGFESVSGLWLGLALPVIVLFYLLKRKYADTPVSSHLLWNRVLKELEANRPWQKLRSRLLMLLQLLAALLAVLAVAGLFLWRDGPAGGAVVYVLDGSASMQAAASAEGRNSGTGQTGYSRMEAAKEAILRHAEESGASSYSMVLLAGQPEVLLAGETDADGLRRALEEAEPVHGAAAYKETLSLAESLAREQRGRLVFATDGQWAEDTESLGLQLPVSLLNIPGNGDASSGIVRFGVAQAAGAASADSGAAGEAALQGVAAVRNWGTQPASAEVSLYAGSRLVAVEQTVLAAGEDRVLSFGGLPASDWYRLSLRADGDSLSADNEQFAFPPGGRRHTVWLVSHGNLFLEKALLLAGAEVVKLQKTEAGYALPRTEADLIVLDGVGSAELGAEDWGKVLQGKPVWSIRTDLPGTVTRRTGGTVQLRQHPVLNYVRWEQVHVAEAVNPGDAGGWEPIVSADGVPLVLTGEGGGQRRLAFTFGLEHSDLALRPDFPILTRNAVDWLTSGTGQVLGTAMAGGTMEIPLSPEASAAGWEPVAGAGMNSGTLEAAISTGGTAAIPQKPGLYRLEEKDAEGREIRSRLLAAVPDLRESDLRHRPDPAFLTEAPDDAAAGGAGQAEGSRSSYPLAPWLAAAMLAVLLWEWEVYRRGNTV